MIAGRINQSGNAKQTITKKIKMVALQAEELTPRILSPGMKLVSPGQLSSLEKKKL